MLRHGRPSPWANTKSSRITAPSAIDVPFAVVCDGIEGLIAVDFTGEIVKDRFQSRRRKLEDGSTPCGASTRRGAVKIASGIANDVRLQIQVERENAATRT